MLHGRRPRRLGQAIIEALVSLSALTVGFLGIFALLSQSFSLNRTVSNNYIANYLATEGIEVVKNVIDNNTINSRAWDSGLTDGTFEVDYSSLSLSANQNRLLGFDPTAHLYSYSGSSPTPFRRTVTLTDLSGTQLKVVSQVNWVDRGGGTFQVTLEDHFYHWRP